jgi:hypothetical protein
MPNLSALAATSQILSLLRGATLGRSAMTKRGMGGVNGFREVSSNVNLPAFAAYTSHQARADKVHRGAAG